MTNLVRITVAVLAFRRNHELRRGLPIIAAQARALNETPEPATCEVLVVDNDPGGSARVVLDELGDPHVHYVIEPEPGIAHARNRALETCRDRDLMIFIDDDEHPEPGWLEALVGLWRSSGAAGVGGRVKSEFEITPEPWIQAGEFFTHRTMPTGTAIEACATNNLLLDLTQIRALGLRFDETLGLSGGEDTLFTRQLVRSGASMLWCDEAVVTEHVPANRLTRQWVRRRSWSHGNTTVMVRLRLADDRPSPAAIRARAVGAGLSRIALGAGRLALGVPSRDLRHRARGWRWIYRGGGMLAAAFGSHFREYADRR